MKILKTKIERVINFIKNEGKFHRGDLVEVIRNNSKYNFYDSYIGKFAVVTNIDYSKKENIVGLKFIDGKNFDFCVNELRKCDYIEQHTNKEYINLLKLI